MTEIAIILSLVHLAYYAIMQIYSDLTRINSKIDLNHPKILELQTKYNVDIRMFHTTNQKHYGFAMHNSIWLSNYLLNSKSKKYPALYYVFHHEYYHLKSRHKIKTLGTRFLFALTPFLLLINGWLFGLIYVGSALGLYYMDQYFEKKADEYAKFMTNGSKEVVNSEE